MLARHAGDGTEVLVVAFDIERLGVINDSFGRHVGDQVVQFVADSVKNQFDGTDSLAHLDGGNFAVVISGRESYEHSVRWLHERLGRAFGQPLVDRQPRDPRQCKGRPGALPGKWRRS